MRKCTIGFSYKQFPWQCWKIVPLTTPITPSRHSLRSAFRQSNRIVLTHAVSRQAGAVAIVLPSPLRNSTPSSSLSRNLEDHPRSQ